MRGVAKRRGVELDWNGVAPLRPCAPGDFELSQVRLRALDTGQLCALPFLTLPFLTLPFLTRAVFDPGVFHQAVL